MRLVTLGVVLLLAMGLFEIWRRVTFHYIHELHRRNRFLLLRRILMFITFAIIFAFGFSTDFGSLTTFAGLLAVGLAVCLQSVILSALDYFVLLGKYRIRAGDRIQISGVTGTWWTGSYYHSPVIQITDLWCFSPQFQKRRPAGTKDKIAFRKPPKLAGAAEAMVVW